MRPPILRLSLDELIVDNFAGGGGASTGIEQAIGRSPDIAINHDPEAIAMHAINHPSTVHYTEDVWKIDPVEVCKGRPVGLAWFSPDCKHHSKAKGGKPRDDRVRGLAWVAIHWAKAVRPRVICLENVEEFAHWGPLLDDGRPCPMRKGLTFRRWLGCLRNLGYDVDWREMRACDFGAPTTRKRLFLVARCDGQPIVWPDPSHGRGRSPYRTAAECIDWSIPCPSIFERSKPLAENTQRRIATGIMRYVLNNPRPFIVPVTHQGDARVHSIDEPFRTVTGAQRGELALITPFVAGIDNKSSKKGDWAGDDPLRTITAENRFAIVAPTLISTRNGERDGQEPRARPVEQPFLTVTAQGSQGALVAAFLAKHNGIGDKMVVGQSLGEPTHTITATDQKAIVTSQIVKLKGTSDAHINASAKPSNAAPLDTIAAEGTHFAEVRAFLIKFYRDGGQWAGCDEPMHTISTKDRMGLVTVTIEGEEYAIVDIGMRMLTPRELYRAQGFPEHYIIDATFDGTPLTKTAQVRMCGNSVAPPNARALVEAQFSGANEAVAA